MVRTVHQLYKAILWCLKPKVQPPLVWYWDSIDMGNVVKDQIKKFEVDEGRSYSDVTALWDPETEAIHATMKLSRDKLGLIIMWLLHELAHANGIGLVESDGEKQADDWALMQFRKLVRSKRWKEATSIKLGLKRGAHNCVPDDRVWTKPPRLPIYQPPWTLERYQ